MRTLDRIALIAAGVAAMAAGDTAAHTLEPLEDGRFEIVFDGRSYDATSDRTRFSYRIDPRGGVDRIRFIVGHGACGELEVLVDRRDATSRIEHARPAILDDHSGIFGTEWVSTLRRWRSTPFWFDVAGNVATGAVRIAIENDDRLLTGLVPGPSCSPTYDATPIDRDAR